MALLQKTADESAEPQPRCWGEYRAHEHCSRQNFLNMALCLLALVPSIASTAALYRQCAPSDADDWSTLGAGLCTLGLTYPLAMANVLFFVNVSLGFWVVGLIQRNFWLIDPYWTLIPPLLCTFYQTNPTAKSNPSRAAVATSLIWIWAARLTFSYFRREHWKFGQQEDWRYTKMAREHAGSWWALSFLAVGVAQQPMLVGISLPSYAVHHYDQAWNGCDVAAVLLCVSGLLLAWFADAQLYAYMQTNQERKRAGQHLTPVLCSGLWRHSRHPNYVGETLWWLGYGLFAVSVGQYWMLCGWVLNTAVLIQVTVMTEQRMGSNRTGDRLELWNEYKRVTGCWVPWACGGAGLLQERVWQYERTGELSEDKGEKLSAVGQA